jgi:integrase
MNIVNINFEHVDYEEFDVRPCNIERTKKALEQTRDAFLFRCFCGIRFSDYLKLTKDKISNGKMTLISQKTGTIISLPLSKLAIEILVRHDFTPPKMHNQNENENLKLLCRIAGFTENVTLTYNRGGKKHEEIRERWELVTTHTARKTFITNCLRAGIEPYLVMEMAGIKKEATFKRYIQVSNKDMNEAIQRLEVYVSKSN